MSSQAKPETIDIPSECKLTCDFEVLRRSPVFTGADTEVIKLFAYLAKRKKYQPGEKIITHKAVAQEAFYLISGTAEVTTFHHSREVTLQRIVPGTFFGELALLARFSWFFNVQPVTECEVLNITRESFQKVLDKFPAKREKIIERIVQLRVERLVEQTTFMLDKIPDSILYEYGHSSSNISI